MNPVSPVIPGIKLPEVVYAKYQPEYIPLPAYRTSDGVVLTRWKLTWAERFRVTFGGNIWLWVLTFNKPLQPVKLEAVCPNMAVQERGEEKP